MARLNLLVLLVVCWALAACTTDAAGASPPDGGAVDTSPSDADAADAPADVAAPDTTPLPGDIAEADASTARNARCLSEFHPADRIVEIPRVSGAIQSGAVVPSAALNRRLDRILALLGA